MAIKKLYEKLEGLPSYGPMYIPISPKGDLFYSEGFVVRFFKSDGSDWVANFAYGWTDFSEIYEYPDRNTVMVIAGGTCYVINPDEEKQKFSFGVTIKSVIQSEDKSLVCADNCHIFIFDNENGNLWYSDRISWDGIKDLEIKNNILHGKTYDPTNSFQEWGNFTLDIKTKKIVGGSYQTFLINNNLEVDNNGIAKEKPKPWWKLF